MEEQAIEPPRRSCGTQLIFILYGVASLLGWNALLTKLDFFSYFLKGMNPSVSFSFLNFILNILFLFLLIIKENLFSLKFQLIGGIIGSIFFLIAIPLTTMFLPKDSLVNYLVTGGLVVLMGFINALASGGFFNFVSYFPLDLIVSFSAGQGFSGIAVLLNYNSEFTRHYLNKINIEQSNDIPEGSLVEKDTLLNEEEQGIINDQANNKEEKEKDKDKSNQENKEENIEEKKKAPGGGCSSFVVIFKKIWDLNLLMAYIYIVTFALFPGASIGQNLFNLKEGRYLVKVLPKTKLFNAIIILGRSILLFTLVFNWYCQDNLNMPLWSTSILLILNVALLAVTNGIGTTLTFGIAPETVEDEYKGLAGTSLSFFVIVGIFLGSCVNFGTNAVISTFKKKEE